MGGVVVPPAVIPASPSRRHSVHVREDFARQRKEAVSSRHLLCMINGLIYTFILLICNPWTTDGCKDPQSRASSLHPLLHACVNTWVCLAVQSAGCWQRVSLQVMQSSHSQSTGCRAAGASLLMLLPLSLSPPSCLDAPNIFPHASCSSFLFPGQVSAFPSTAHCL